MDIQELQRFVQTGSVGNSALADVGSTPEILIPEGLRDLLFTLTVATQNLQDFALWVKSHADASWAKLYDGTEWDTIGNILTYKNGPIHDITTADVGFARVNIGNVYSIKFQAQASSGTSAVTIRGTLGRG